MGRERQRGAPLLDRHSKTIDCLTRPAIAGAARGSECVAFFGQYVLASMAESIPFCDAMRNKQDEGDRNEEVQRDLSTQPVAVKEFRD